jgi:hypothetical protein
MEGRLLDYGKSTIYYCGVVSERLKPSVLRPVVWMGNSKKSLRDFPEGAQKTAG